MKAIVKPAPGIGLQLVEAPMPTVGPSDVLIQVKAAGICGSDTAIYNWDDPWVRVTVKPGHIVGHEFSGTVVDRGDCVDGVQPGLLVTAEGHLSCGRCRRCTAGAGHVCSNLRLIGYDYPGAFAEYVSVPSASLRDSAYLSPEIAAIQDPFGNAVHATSIVDVTNSSVLVAGSGPIGLMTIKLLLALRARLIIATDISDYRVNMAKSMGADYVVNANGSDVEAATRGLCGAEGVDVLFEMSGNAKSLVAYLPIVRAGGTVVLVGLAKTPITLDVANDIVAKGISLHGITGRRLHEDWSNIRNYLDGNSSRRCVDLSSVITHKLPFEEFDLGFELMKSGQCGKVVLFPS